MPTEFFLSFLKIMWLVDLASIRSNYPIASILPDPSTGNLLPDSKVLLLRSTLKVRLHASS